ncbi:uncharacterized protein EAF02_004831 [Botrytis sinoallii]|uniref:uncharacterized protein n=1 Tax=Botrytis sinoallii TaxID=1463999 RepID=UPI001900170B|nr:uncharacterized protein EAF02_004831 [Botrytis sinoallii]KAF7884495.1 hypothetical protein EAF02_004831 [Botrytis sinoallii]
MVASQDIAKRDVSSMRTGGEKNGDNNAAEELRDLESDAESVDTKAGSIWTIMGSAMANYSDGYQQGLASSTNVVFNHLLGTKIYTSTIQTRISNALLIGRHALYIRPRDHRISPLNACIASPALLTHALVPHHRPRHRRRGRLEGEYPSSAAAALEGSADSFDAQRGPIQVFISTLMATTGSPTCTLVYLLALLASHNNLTVAFHAIYSISTLLPLVVMLVRLRMTDGKLFRASNFRTRPTPWRFVLRTYGLRALGTSTAFFLYDFVNFPNSIMSAAIINGLVPGKNIRTVAIWQFVLAIFPIPGVLLGMWLVNRIGRKWTGILGFAGYIFLGFIIGGCYGRLTTAENLPAFIVLYGLFASLGHMGPGATIGLMSAESFPTAIRGWGMG